MLIILIFSNDPVLLAKSEVDLQQSLHELQRILTNYNMNILETKTKVMAMNGTSIPWVKIVINNKIIKQVTRFIYLAQPSFTIQ